MGVSRKRFSSGDSKHKPPPFFSAENFPLWLSYNYDDLEPPIEDPRCVGYEFLKEAAEYFPDDSRINKNCVALALESSVHKWAESHCAQGKIDNWVSKYIEKLDEVCAGIMGKKFPKNTNIPVGSIVSKIVDGQWKDADDLVSHVTRKDWFKSHSGDLV